MNEPITNEILAKYFSDELNSEERTLLQKWLDEDIENQKILADYEQIWQESRLLSFDTEVAWKKVVSQINTKPAKQFFGLSSKIFRMAATLVFCLGLGAYLFIFKEKQSNILLTKTENQTIEKTLSDGSKILLNKNSQLSFPETFTGDKREVTLVGEAFFEITTDASKPFIIHAQNTEIRVLGTSFNVKTTNQNVVVSVRTGRVEFSAKKQKVVLKKEQEATYLATEDTLKQLLRLDPNVFAYKTKVYVFEASSLDHVAAVLSDAYQIPIIVKDKQIKSYQITTRFENESLPNTLNIIAETLNLNLRTEGKKYIFEKK